MLNLCVTENVGLGLTYFKILSSRLEESARQRIIAPNEFAGLLSSEQLDVKEQARRELNLAFRGQVIVRNRPRRLFLANVTRPTRALARATALTTDWAPVWTPELVTAADIIVLKIPEVATEHLLTPQLLRINRRRDSDL